MRAVAFLFLLCAASSASAQTRVYDVTYRPAGSTFLVVQTPNFEVIYEAGYEREAAELAWQLERYLPTAADMIGHRGWMRMPVILRGYDDTANGFVSVRPFRQEIDAAGIKGPVITSQFGSWIEAVAPHELVHALHADTRHGGGIGSIIRPFAPDHARSINLGNPSGVSEGIAVRFESSIRDGAGRMSHPHFVMKFRAAMAEGRWSLARMLEPSHVSLPFDRHYVGGAFYIDHLADDGDVEAFRRARRAFYRFPFLGYGVSMWWGNREAPFRTGAAIRERWYRIEQERLLTNGPFDEPTRIISEVGMMIQSPRWLSADELVVHARGYSTRAGFYRVDAESGWMRLIAHEGLSGEGTFHLDSSRGQIIFSRYDADVLPTDAARAGVYRLDVEARRTTPAMSRSRIHAPVNLPDGSILGLRNDGQESSIVRINVDGDVEAAFEGRMLFRQLAVRPSSNEVAILANIAGQEGVLIGGIDDLDGTLAPWLFLADMPIYDISWSADGSMLIFTSAEAGVSNIYALEVAGERFYRLTNARFGALQGAASPDDQTLAYVNYEHDRYELAVTPLLLEQEVTPDRLEIQWPQERTVYELPDPAPYQASRYLFPRLLSPVVIVDDDTAGDGDFNFGPGLGLSLEGVDPLMRWAYGGNVYYRKHSAWGSAGVSYGASPLRPTLRVFREPSTVVAQFPDGETARIGRERRGVGLDFSLPLTLDANVFTSRVALGLSASYEQERLFDDDNRMLAPSGLGGSFRDLASIRPSASVMYRVQANTRDLAPNTGAILSTGSRIDIWDELDAPARSVMSRLYVYLPLMAETNTSIRLDGGLLVQNARQGISTTLFLPRGYRNRYLGDGSFGRAGVEIIQPLAFVDDGSILIPFFIHAVYGFATAEQFHQLGGGATFGSASVGLGLRLRVFHHTELDLRWGVTARTHGLPRFTFR